MKTLLSMAALLMISPLLQGQWYDAYTNYVYESLSVEDSTVKIQLIVQYNDAGNCTVTKSTHTAGSGDGYRSFYFGTQGNLDTTNGNYNLSVGIGETYYWIPFDDFTKAIHTGTSAEVVCDCKQGNSTDADCDPVSFPSGGTICTDCVEGLGCNVCKEPYIKEGNVEIYGGWLLLQADGTVTLTEP